MLVTGKAAMEKLPEWTAWEKKCLLAAAEHRNLPWPDAIADLSVAGWTLNHLLRQHPDTWGEEILAAISEMKRVTRPSGSLVIIESLGTAVDKPGPPSERLALYYRLLQEQGFQMSEIRTDYQFPSLSLALELTDFFFGEKVSRAVGARGSSMVPEFTGVWSRASR
jgi:ubiquinone/menaquinone biosynthesis C-methylase UbiE